jgi:hypothetical protein
MIPLLVKLSGPDFPKAFRHNRRTVVHDRPCVNNRDELREAGLAKRVRYRLLCEKAGYDQANTATVNFNSYVVGGARWFLPSSLRGELW